MEDEVDWEDLFDVDELPDQLANMQVMADENLELNATSNFPPSTWFSCSSVWSIQQLYWPFSTCLVLMAPLWLAEIERGHEHCWARRFLRSARTYSFPTRWGTWRFPPKRTCSAETKATGALCQYQWQHWRGVRVTAAWGSIDDEDDDWMNHHHHPTPTTTESSQPMVFVYHKLWVKKHQKCYRREILTYDTSTYLLSMVLLRHR